jgi:Zn-dependent protease with chaperone function
MTTISAKFYDGKISLGTPVRIHLEFGSQLRISDLGEDLIYGLSEIRISTRVGDTPRSIYLPGGAMCETSENDTIDAFLRREGRRGWQAAVYVLESKWRYALFLLLVTIVGVWVVIEHGIPALAKRAAFAFPTSADMALGRDGLKILDQTLFSPSGLEKNRQDYLRTFFDAMTKELADGHVYRLEFRKSDRIGANAFALPSGIVVVTDKLVLLAQDQNEIIGVLAHEIGHVKHRHALCTLLQNSAVALLVTTLSGDLASLTKLSAALPTLLVEAGYSRSFETEADQFVLRYLLEHDIPPADFAVMLGRLEKETLNKGEENSYLASHPVTSERIKMFMEGR